MTFIGGSFKVLRTCLRISGGSKHRLVKSLVLLCCATFLFGIGQEAFAQGPPWSWAQISAQLANQSTQAVAIDSHNAVVYIAGDFQDSVSIGGLTAVGPSHPTVFIAQLDFFGNANWLVPVFSTADAHLADISLGTAGNLFLCGDFQNVIVFQTTASPIVINSAGGMDGFVANFDPLGNCNSAVGIGGPGADRATGISSRGGQLYTCGSFTWMCNFPGGTSLTALGGRDAFLWRGNPATGNTIWARRIGSTGNDDAVAVGESAGSVTLTGTYESAPLSFQNSPRPALPNQGLEDVFIGNYSQIGNANWENRMGSTTSESVNDLVVNPAGAFVTGRFQTNASFYHSTTNINVNSAGSDDLFLAGYDLGTGDPIWAIAEGGPDNEEGLGVAIDNAGELYVAGTFEGSSSSIGGFSMPQANGPDGLVAHYNQAGNYQWVSVIAGDNSQVPLDLDTYAGEVFVGGFVNDTSIFTLIPLPYGGGEDAFLAKLGCPNSNSTAYSTIGGTDTILCGDTLQLSGLIGTSWTGFWSDTSGTVQFNNASDPSAKAWFPGAGNYTLVWQIQSGSCTISDSITVQKVASITLADAGPDTVLCTDSLVLQGNDPNPGTGLWTILSGNCTLSSPADSNSIASGFDPNNNTLVWTVTNGTCSTSDTVVVTSNYFPPPSAGMDTIICGTSLNLMAEVPTTGGSGGWIQDSNQVNMTIVGASIPMAMVIGIPNDTTWVAWNWVFGGCASSDTLEIIAFHLPDTAIAGLDEDLCANGSHLLSANAPNVGTGTWTGISAGLSYSNVNQANATVSGLVTGANEMQWTISNGICPSNSDTLVLNVFDSIPSSAGPDQSLCDTFATTLQGSDPLVGSGLWTVLAGTGNVTVPTDSNSTATGLATGLNQLSWTVTNGACISTDTVDIDVTVSLMADAGSDQTLCVTDSAQLTGNPAGPNGGLWSVLTGPGQVTNATDPSSGLQATSAGTVLLEWLLNNGACPTTADTVTVDFLALPFVDAGPDQALCESGSTALMGNDPGGLPGMWSQVQGAASLVTPTDSATAVSNLAIDSHVFVWTITDSLCAPVSDSVTIENFALIPADAGNDLDLCDTNAVELSASNAAPGNGSWQPVAGLLFSNFSDSNAVVSDLSTGLNQLIWDVQNGVCIDSDTLNIFVTILSNPADAGPDQALCDSTSTLLQADNFPGMGMWVDLGGNLTFSDPTAPNAAVSNLVDGQNTLVWIRTEGACSSSDTVEINVSPLPSAAEAGPDQEITQAATELQAAAPAIGAGSWSVLLGSGVFEDSNLPATTVSGVSFGANQYVWTVVSGVCPASSDTLTVNFNELVIPTGFSPNGDGKNDNWVVQGVENYAASLAVFNRWGNLVYESDSYSNEWNGNNKSGGALTDDTYYYVLKFGDGREFNGYVVIKR